MIFVLLGVTLLIFTIMWYCPGDPARSLLSDDATEEQIEELREEMGDVYKRQPMIFYLR